VPDTERRSPPSPAGSAPRATSIATIERPTVSASERPSRVVVELVAPVVDGGRFAAKGSVGEHRPVVADVFGDGHDPVVARLDVLAPGSGEWRQYPLTPSGNDRWTGGFVPDRIGRWWFRVAGAMAGPDSTDRGASSEVLAVDVDPARARYSSWYEVFPRSVGHGTLTDVIAHLPYVASMGFDVLYLPPVHPIGRSYRKGPNNTADPGPDDPGSPWAIGNGAGGHTAVDPALGTVADVARLATAAAEHGIAVALDLAFQCSPDHPWVTEHPEFFRRRADGSIRYAENPPKKYQDIYPLDFESAAWRDLWAALLDVVQFWVGRGVRVFRVDNPHTKPFAFWEWLISEVRSSAPDVVFLAEAFTKPRVMERLAKCGFNQSYTYFTWKQTADELREYFTDLSTRTVDFLRPNAWPNTPDILTEQLQRGGRPVFALRAVLAATLSANWGVYGPAFELMEHTPRSPGTEEYVASEKYERRYWNLTGPDSLAPLLGRLNRIRADHPSLQQDRTLRFHHSDNPNLLVYSKHDPDGGDAVLVIVNLDPDQAQHGWIDVDLAAVGLPYESSFHLHDELSGDAYWWTGAWSWVRLDPDHSPAHIFSVRCS